jgi:hypothetical protein
MPFEKRSRCSKDVGNINTNCEGGQETTFSLYSFCKENTDLFAIIGILGTLIALLPVFIESFFGANWKISLLANFGGILLLSAFIVTVFAGAFFIVILGVVILRNVIFYNLDYEVIGLAKLKFIANALMNPQKFIFLLFLTLSFGAFIFFIFSIILNTNDPIITIISIFTFLLILLILITHNLVSSVKSIKSTKIKFFIMGIIIVIGLAITYIYVIQPFLLLSPYPIKGNLEIITDVDNYTPYNSSSIGIGLTPSGQANISEFSERDFRFLNFYYLQLQWSTNYGYFISRETDGKFLKSEGMGTIIDLKDYKDIFWTYPVSDIGLKKPNVTVSLKLQDSRTSQVINSSFIKFSWKNNDTAIVTN